MIPVPDNALLPALLGPADELLRLIEAAFPDTDILLRGNQFTITGPEAAEAGRLIEEQIKMLRSGVAPTPAELAQAIDMVKVGERPSEVLSHEVLRSARGRPVRPKTAGQKRYVDAINSNTVTFGTGPAGTGKSYLAVAMAVQYLRAKKVERIILTRPAVEAGERLGFLPGDLLAKVDPYLRPLYDALYDMLTPEATLDLMQKAVIEIAPLAYMRGRAQPFDAQVLTPSGFRDMGSLHVGDAVIGSSGAPTEVLGIYPLGRRAVFRLTTQDGASTLCCGEHLWSARTPEDRRRGRTRLLETQQLAGDLRRGHVRRFELPLVGPVEFEPAGLTPLDPYALGLLLGDGCITTSTTPSFAGAGAGAGADAELVGALASACSNPLAAAAQRGPARRDPRTKVIPDSYLRGSPASRLALLQGLLDACGVAHAGARRIQFSSTSARLVDDVVFLVRSLGGVASPRHGPGARRRDRSRPVSDPRLDIHLPAGVDPFRLARQRTKYDLCGGGRPMRMVDRIEPVGARDVMCIRVAAPDSLYVTDDFLVTHNTLNDAFVILDEAQNSTREQMKMFLTRLGFGSKAVVTGDASQVDLDQGRSGLIGLENILEGIDGLAFVRFTAKDVVRHRIVQDIVDAYDAFDTRKVR